MNGEARTNGKTAGRMMGRSVTMLQRTNFGVAVAALALLTVAGLCVMRGMAQDVPGPVAGGHVVAAAAQGEYAHRTMSFAMIAAAVATGLGSLAAGYAVSAVGTAAMGAVAEKPELMGKSLIYVALAEGIAIYGLLISIIILAKV